MNKYTYLPTYPFKKNWVPWQQTRILNNGLTFGFCSLQPYDHLLGKGWSLVCCVSCVFVTFPYVSWSTSELRVSLVLLNMFNPSSDYLLPIPMRCFICGFFLYLCFMFIFAMFSYLILVVTCWERAGLLDLLWMFLYFCHFPIWCSWSGVLIECIDHWSSPYFLLLISQFLGHVLQCFFMSF